MAAVRRGRPALPRSLAGDPRAARDPPPDHRALRAHTRPLRTRTSEALRDGPRPRQGCLRGTQPAAEVIRTELAEAVASTTSSRTSACKRLTACFAMVNKD